MITNWFLTFGAMALPIGFALFFIYWELENIPVVVYYFGWVAGIFGLISFFMAFIRSFIEDREKRENDKKTDEHFKSAMKILGSIKGQMEGIRNDIRKSNIRK